MSGPCIELAKLFSIAVDFNKTGVPAVIPPKLHVKEYPDFMEKPDKPTYGSCNVIGKLFREVKDIAPNTNYYKSFTAEAARRSYDSDMEVDGFEDFIDDAVYYKGNYDDKLGNLMDYYGIKTEAEILSGNIIRMGKSFTKRRDSEAITMAVRSLRKEAKAWFNERGSKLDSEADDVYAKASAWYHVTYHHSYWGTYNEVSQVFHYGLSSYRIVMESVTATSAKIEERKRRNREAVKKAENKKDQHMKDMLNKKSSLEKDIKIIQDQCAVIIENQKAYDLKKTYLRAETTIFEQYANLLSQYYIMRHDV
nr:rna-dependent rna polymerase 1 [Quercus suber]